MLIRMERPLVVKLALCSLLLFSLLRQGYPYCTNLPRHGNHLILGSKSYHDKQIYKERIWRDWKRDDCVSETVTFGRKNLTITRVELIDFSPEGCGAIASIVDGGPGKSTVTVRFESKYQGGIDFVAQIYGYMAGGNSCTTIGGPGDYGNRTFDTPTTQKSRRLIIIIWLLEELLPKDIEKLASTVS